MKRETVYTVWRRSDNFVAATASSNGSLPSSCTYRDSETGVKVTVTFEELLVTGDWPAAAMRIKAERVGDEMNGIKPAWQ